jgi:hypothetical protein
MRAEHIRRSRVGSCSAALPAWTAGKFTDGQAAVMRAVGIEMLNKRGVCALRLEVIADAAGVSVGTARARSGSKWQPKGSLSARNDR